MNRITLLRDGGVTSQGQPIQGPVLRFLRCAVELAGDYTLRAFFLMIGRYPELGELSEFMPSLLARAASAGPGERRVEGVDRLTLLRTVEMVGFPGKPRMEIYTSLLGDGPSGRMEVRLLQIEDLLDTPLTLGPLRHVVLGDSMDIFEFETEYTLFDFIEGVSWELSFHGTPLSCKIGSNIKR
ncbi:MAG: hypothetical protein AB7D57_04205 [Desulfovibrionaceae bacterium]